MATKQVPIMRKFGSPFNKPIIVLLALYAVLVIAFDTGRPFFNVAAHPGEGQWWPQRWYPIAKPDFETDKDGKVTTGSAKNPGIKEGNHIDLASIRPDRRIINKFVFVAHDSSYSFRVRQNGWQPAVETVKAEGETFNPSEKWMLLLAQMAGFIFIVLGGYLAWRHPAPQTWGLFLYSVGFNSGQYFFWYANLPISELIIFNFVQAFFQAVGLTGFLAFALYFPYDDLRGRRGGAQPYLSYLLGVTLGVLFVFNSWGFMTLVKPWPTEGAWDIYYGMTWIVYGLSAWLLWSTYRTRPRAAPKVRWIVLSGIWGLGWWLLADIYETTSGLDWLANLLAHWPYPWLERHWGMTRQAILNLMYAQNVWVPIAVVYTARHHRVMGVRYFITRALIFGVVSLAFIGVEHFFVEVSSKTVGGRLGLEGFEATLALIVAWIVARLHGPLHRSLEPVLYREWHQAKQELERVKAQLIYNEALAVRDVNQILVDRVSTALRVGSTALFHRGENGSFVREEPTFRWADGVMKRLPADHCFVDSQKKSVRLTSLTTGNPVHLRDPDDEVKEYLDESWNERPPILAVPLVILKQVSRILLLNREEDFDPDEVREIREVGKAAVVA